MLPVIFSFGPFALYTFGLFLFLAFFSGLFVIWRRGKENHFEEEGLMDASMSILFWMFIGARLFYVLAHFNEFMYAPWNAINIVGKPGFWYAGAMVGWWFALNKEALARKWDKYALADVLVVGLCLAQVLVSIGTFFNGSGYGLPTNSFLGVTFPGLYDRRHPVQLYESLLFLGLFVLLWKLEGVYRTFHWYKQGRSEANSGFLAASFFIGYGLLGLILCVLRPAYVMAWGVRLDVLAQILWLLVGIALMVYRSGLKWNMVVEWFKPVPIPGVNDTRELRDRKRDRSRIKLGQDILD